MKSNDLAFVFPGQGSQKIGMLAELATEHPVVETLFDKASDVLGYDLWALSQKGTADAISKTEVTQPLMLTASVSIWHIWQELGGVAPSVMAGHSLGEWSALTAAGVIGFEDAVHLVRLRGASMQAAVPEGVGSMAAIVGLSDERVEEACDSVLGDQFVSPVNYNSPGQVVIAGHAEAVDLAIEKCKELGAKRALPLPVSAPFHTPLMQPAADVMEQALETVQFNAPQIPVVQNANLIASNTPEAIKSALIKQITGPVPWVSTISSIHSSGVVNIVECGPGKVLSGLSKRISREIKSFNTDTPSALAAALTV